MKNRDLNAVASIGRRLQEFLDWKGINPTQAAGQIGTSTHVLANLSAGANVSGKTIMRIAQAFPDLNLDWWLFGIGPMTTEPTQSTTAEPHHTLRHRAEKLLQEPPGKTNKAQEQQVRAWVALFDHALTERLDLLNTVVKHQDQVIALLTAELQAHA